MESTSHLVLSSTVLNEGQNSSYSYELFGLDFMLTDTYEVLLIEVNANPDLAVKCSV